MTGPRPWHRWYPSAIEPHYVPALGTVTQLFLDLVAAHHDRVAILYRDREIRYGEIGRQAAMFGHALRRHGLAKGDRVALHLPNCPYHPYAFFGTLLAGGVVVHLSPLDAFEELHLKLADSGARILVAPAEGPAATMAERLLAAGAIDTVVSCPEAGMHALEAARGAVGWSDFVAGCPETPDAVPVTPDDLALLQYTGGTTGLPKAAMTTHANLHAAVAIYRHWFSGEPETGACETALVVAPLTHIMALSSSLLRRLADGARLVLHQRFDAAAVLADVERHRITSLGGVPTMWIALYNHPDAAMRDLSSLQHLSSGGAPLPAEVHRRVNRWLAGRNLRGGWGMTETNSAGTNVPPGVPDDKAGTIGVPLPGMDMGIVALDDPRRALAQGEVGEIRVRGPNVVSGYWRRPEETAAAFVDGWHLTGDVGFIDEDGLFHIVDRKKDMIISSGFNVYPLVIEKAVHAHPSVAEAMVIGVPDAYRGEAAKAFVVLHPGAAPFTLEALRAFLADRLGRHELPAALEFRDSLPRTAVGKYARRLLRQGAKGRSND